MTTTTKRAERDEARQPQPSNDLERLRVDYAVLREALSNIVEDSVLTKAAEDRCVLVRVELIRQASRLL
jgi:hypothetical protein